MMTFEQWKEGTERGFFTPRSSALKAIDGAFEKWQKNKTTPNLVDFSTSGLENPLTHLLLIAFLWVWWDEPDGPRRLRRLSLVAALCLLTRMDLAPLIAAGPGPQALPPLLRRHFSR